MQPAVFIVLDLLLFFFRNLIAVAYVFLGWFSYLIFFSSKALFSLIGIGLVFFLCRFKSRI